MTASKSTSTSPAIASKILAIIDPNVTACDTADTTLRERLIFDLKTNAENVETVVLSANQDGIEPITNYFC